MVLVGYWYGLVGRWYGSVLIWYYCCISIVSVWYWYGMGLVCWYGAV